MAIPRLSLIELEDLSWWPRTLRDAMTGYLQEVISRSRPYAPAAEILTRMLQDAGTSRIVDLASGGGGPWRTLLGDLQARGVEAEVTCTDLYPSSARHALEGVLYLAEPLSALDVPPSLPGVRTMFSALHHFNPEQVRTLIRNMQRDRAPFAAFEATKRSAGGLLVTLFIPIAVLLVMPLVRPVRPLALLLTYIPPLMPMFIWWDGFVSTLRTYTVAELQVMVRECAEPGYEWEVREVKGPGAPFGITCLTGRLTGEGRGVRTERREA